jgi:hypothetical protein
MQRAMFGIALGTVGALLAARAMASLLFGVASTDPVSFIGVAVCCGRGRRGDTGARATGRARIAVGGDTRGLIA